MSFWGSARAATPSRLVVVAGDVNSTLAGALAAVKLHVPVAHIEAGLRSFDRTMPEEHNRRLTDAVSSLLLTHSDEALDNLLREGVDADSVHLVGNTMIDSLLAHLPHALDRSPWERYGLVEGALVFGNGFGRMNGQLTPPVRGAQ